MTLSRLVASLSPAQWSRYRDELVLDVTDDSRRVRPGSLFVAVPGVAVDGHRFVAQALEWGACAVVCEALPQPLPECPVVLVPDARAALSALAAAFNRHPAHRLCMVGVTGTDGKTTTTELCRAILATAGHEAGALGTVSYNLGGCTLHSNQTTPHPLALHGMLREMECEGLTHVCMEVSSHSLVQKRTADVPFRVAALTNVTQDHLDFHGSLENYVAAKQLLFAGLGRSATAVLNADSSVCARYMEVCLGNTLTYGMAADADVKGVRLSAGLDGMTMAVSTPDGPYELCTPMVGAYNCENILAAVTVALALGVDSEAVREGVAGFRGVAGRLERIGMPRGQNAPGGVFVDYAHTPNGLRSVLSALRELTRGRLICLFGCGGDREKLKRPMMGRVGAELADVTIVTSDNSRSEPTVEIIAQIVAGMPETGARCIAEPDRRTAIELALDQAHSPDDVVAICGRGCEQIQVIGGDHIPFDDRAVTRQILRDREAEQCRKIA